MTDFLCCVFKQHLNLKPWIHYLFYYSTFLLAPLQCIGDSTKQTMHLLCIEIQHIFIAIIKSVNQRVVFLCQSILLCFIICPKGA